MAVALQSEQREELSLHLAFGQGQEGLGLEDFGADAGHLQHSVRERAPVKGGRADREGHQAVILIGEGDVQVLGAAAA